MPALHGADCSRMAIEFTRTFPNFHYPVGGLIFLHSATVFAVPLTAQFSDEWSADVLEREPNVVAAGRPSAMVAVGILASRLDVSFIT